MKLMFQWDENSIRWYQNASEYQPYHKTLARSLLEFIDATDTVCDMGCGLGYLSLALAPHVRRIDGIDISSEAIFLLREKIKEKKITNISAYVGDFENSTPPKTPYNAIIFCFFGDIAKYYTHATEWTDKYIILVVNQCGSMNFTRKPHTAASMNSDYVADFLNKNGLPYKCRNLKIPFGQPFLSLDDARKFMEHYSDDNPNDIDRFLKEHLVEGEKGFSYYLPYEKSLAIFAIHV
ncbi:MAG: class I SAM-dependent methyltransferase [Syntrophomonadaceae bacterium]|jgi:cyclopropane fatty-acyl-phospholipid synthase-like methyltransferase|nr:class I SAM-dependent methyltransferase [Syntrophomonadaceae bacterium]